MKSTAIILGASGLIGNHLLQKLLAEQRYSKVVSIGRRVLDIEHEKLDQAVVDFERLEEYAEHFSGDDLYICLGTTRAAAGSDEAFRKVDLAYVVAAGRLGVDGGCKRCALVSSVGADANSSMLYPKTKGEAEEALLGMSFESLHILRPSMLLGDRKEFRLGEVVATPVMKLLDFIVGKHLGGYRPVEAEKVAEFMLKVMLSERQGNNFYDSNEIVSS